MTKLTDSAGAKETPSYEGNFEVPNSLKQELKKRKWVQELMPSCPMWLTPSWPMWLMPWSKRACQKRNFRKNWIRPENCESLTKVWVNESIWDHLTPAGCLQDVRLQKVQTSIFKGMCALTTMIDKCLDHIPLLPNRNNLLQLSTDALALFANPNSELNQCQRELIKPDVHHEYKHLCSSSLAMTDPLFGDDLPKQVK